MKMLNYFISGIWKRRFPILKRLRLHLPNAIKVVIATAMLHNLSISWGEVAVEELPDHPDIEGQDIDMPDVPHADISIEVNVPPETRRRMGQAERDNLHQNMDPIPTSSERRRLGLRT